MKISIMVIGIILFLIGCFKTTKWLIATGIIVVLMSFFGKGRKKGEDIENKKNRTKQEMKCPNCKSEILEDDNYCQECGKKIIP